MKIFLVALMILIFPIMAFAGSTAISGSTSEAGAIAGALNDTTFVSPNIPLQAQPIYPYLLQIVPGVVADVTDQFPDPDAIQKFGKNDKYVKAITFNGWFLDRIRIEDVEQEIIDHLPAVMKKFGVDTTERIGFRVGMKMSSRTIGSGGGGGGSIAGFGGGSNPLSYGANASVLPAVAVNTADPQFVIRYYLKPLGSKKVSMTDEQYRAQGWKKVE